MANNKFDLSNVISQIKEPLLLSNYLKWEILNWDLNKWNDVLGNAELEFRYGWNANSHDPQWEKTTPFIKGNFNDFLNFASSDRWLYFDYKYMRQWLLNAEELREKIKFDDLGLKDVTVNDSTIWIGTKGAHTPCHVDTYGCNVVIQLYGQKLWLLFEPTEDLKATRVPYEESTIYSRLNFFSPSDISAFKEVHNARLVVLNPGDVLIIPNKWWHYVESLDKSISLNTWLPLPEDHFERKQECLLQVLIGSVLKNADEEVRTSFLNPDSYDILNQPFNETVDFLTQILDVKNIKRDESCMEQVSEFLASHPYIKVVETLSEINLEQFLESQSKRFTKEIKIEDGTSTLKKIAHAITHPDVISLILKKITEG